jgi:hypothetical protein
MVTLIAHISVGESIVWGKPGVCEVGGNPRIVGPKATSILRRRNPRSLVHNAYRLELEGHCYMREVEPDGEAPTPNSKHEVTRWPPFLRTNNG